MSIRARLNEQKPRAAFARIVGISSAYACQIAKGERIGSLKTFVKIGDALRLTDAEFRNAARDEVGEAPAATSPDQSDAA